MQPLNWFLLVMREQFESQQSLAKLNMAIYWRID